VSAFLQTVFSGVCGQNPNHMWMPGGWVLPCCQRCVGLYAGAALAVALQIWVRPRPTGRFLKCHGLFLVQMVPFGFHWVSQGAVLRTVTGYLFGFGLIAFLGLQARQIFGWSCSSGAGPLRRYYFTLGLGLMTVLALALWGGQWGALVLIAWVMIGALALVVLAGANLALGLTTLGRSLPRTGLGGLR
jgi:uncharacterized membrane protein